MDKEHLIMDIQSLLMDTNIDRTFDQIMSLLDKFANKDLDKVATSRPSLLILAVNKPIARQLHAKQAHIFAELLSKGCDVNARDDYGWTPLHYACNYNLTDVARLCANEPLWFCDINAPSKRQLKPSKEYNYVIGTTPLHICAWLDHFELAKYLVERGADVHLANESAWSCLHICARQDHADFAAFLIEQPEECQYCKDDKNETAPIARSLDELKCHMCITTERHRRLTASLLLSSRHGHYQIARLLLHAGANVDYCHAEDSDSFDLDNQFDQSPLYAAVLKGHVEVCRVLIEYNANTNLANDKQGNTPLHACAMMPPDEVDEEADERSSSESRNKQVRLAELLIERGADPMLQNELGWTPLHYAAKNNCALLADYLLAKRKILLDMKNVYGETALFVACKWHSLQVVELLLVNYADKNVADLNGVHPFVCERVVQGRF